MDKIIIAHRGILNGNSEQENHPGTIAYILEKTEFHCEIDLWFYLGEYYLGHNEPKYEINFSFMEYLLSFSDRVWLHVKNCDVFPSLLDYKMVDGKEALFNYFWHESDDYTLTSHGYLWCYPGQPPTHPKSIIVMPEDHGVSGFSRNLALDKCVGVCTDFPEIYYNYFEDEEKFDAQFGDELDGFE
jgi:hypothetical protein